MIKKIGWLLGALLGMVLLLSGCSGGEKMARMGFTLPQDPRLEEDMEAQQLKAGVKDTVLRKFYVFEGEHDTSLNQYAVVFLTRHPSIQRALDRYDNGDESAYLARFTLDECAKWLSSTPYYEPERLLVKEEAALGSQGAYHYEYSTPAYYMGVIADHAAFRDVWYAFYRGCPYVIIVQRANDASQGVRDVIDALIGGITFS